MKKRTSQAPCLFGLGCKHTDLGGNSAEMISPRESPCGLVHCSVICLGLFQVSRNFELVGRVNLDQLEQMKEKMESSSSDDEDKDDEMSSKAEDRG